MRSQNHKCDRRNHRDYQEINYPLLWGGHLVRPCQRAGETPTPQEKLYIFLFGSPINASSLCFDSCASVNKSAIVQLLNKRLMFS